MTVSGVEITCDVAQMRTAELQSPTVGTTCSVSGLQWVLEERLRAGQVAIGFWAMMHVVIIVLCRISTRLSA